MFGQTPAAGWIIIAAQSKTCRTQGAFQDLVIDRMEGNEEIFGKLMSDAEFRKLAVEHLLHKVYGALKGIEK